ADEAAFRNRGICGGYRAEAAVSPRLPGNPWKHRRIHDGAWPELPPGETGHACAGPESQPPEVDPTQHVQEADGQEGDGSRRRRSEYEKRGPERDGHECPREERSRRAPERACRQIEREPCSGQK